MDFPQYDFDSMNEADIREEIIAPLLRHLGYRSGTDHNIIREQPLSYPKSFLGRKKGSGKLTRGTGSVSLDAMLTRLRLSRGDSATRSARSE